MKLLMIGDVVGSLGCEALKRNLSSIRRTYSPDFIVVNGENAAPNGRGITPSIVKEWLGLGVNCITLGNHAWGQNDLLDLVDTDARIIRPANFPDQTPGQGYSVFSTAYGKCTVINLLGKTFMTPLLHCPFETMDRLLEEIDSSYILVDFHAETTSEKQAMAWYLDGRVSAVIGTHTHVQTADERILPRGTGYLSDVGMVGPRDGILGMDRDLVIRRFRTQLPVRFEVAKGDWQLNAVLLSLDKESKKTREIKRIQMNTHTTLMD